MAASQKEARTVTYSGAELDRRIVRTAQFQHVVFANRIARSGASAPVWVFLDGDGNAWLRDGRTAEDPTPAKPLALDLLTGVPAPATYLGRPCAFGTVASDPACGPAVWTVDRYSPRVVESLRQAVLMLPLANAPIVLVGYSGGGVLAVQLARRLENAVGVITIAANLDVAAWADQHGYAPALAARTAAKAFPLRGGVLQLHVFGGRDTNAPYALAGDLLASDPNAHVRIFQAADHDCCWVGLWPEILAEFQQLMDAAALMRSSSSLR